MQRTRSRSKSAKFGFGSNPTQYLNGPAVYTSITDNNPGPGGCYHVTHKPFTGYAGFGGGQRHYATNLPAPSWIGDSFLSHPSVSEQVALLASNLNWNKLPTSSTFKIIQFLAELDDTLAMFTKKFISKLSYGAVTWGVMPFLSEMVALLDAINRIIDLINSESNIYPYHDSESTSVSFDYVGGELLWDVTVDIKMRNNGSIHMPQFDILQLYDLIGFQPSISTAWDLIPLSFAIDWFIPVGSFLDGLKASSGWVTHIYYEGWTSYTLEYKISPSSTQPYHPDWKPVANWSGKVFHRYYNRCVLNDIEYEPKQDWFEMPSFMELFNTFYLLSNRR